MVGFGYQAEHSSTGNTKRVSRCYILFPMVMSHPKIITVHQVNDAEPIVSESEFGFVFYVVWLLVCLVGTWWFLVPAVETKCHLTCGGGERE